MGLKTKSLPILHTNFAMKIFTSIVASLLITIGLNAQEFTLNIANVSFAEGELVSKENRNNYDANGQLGAGLIIESNLEGLTFQSLNGIIRQIKNGNQSKLLLSPEERILTVFSEGFLPLEIILRDVGVSLESGTFWKLQIVGNNASNTTAIAIRVDPPDAKIYLNDELQDSANILEVDYGLYELKIEKTGYSTISDLFKIDENSGQFLVKEYKLDLESYQKVTISGFPQNTDIYIDGIKQEGVFSNSFSTNLYPGTYDFSFLNQDYFLKEQQVIITAGSDINLPIRLQKNSSYFTTKTEPRESEVWINYEKYPSNQTVELRPGKFPIAIIKSGFETVYDTLEFRVGDRIEKDYRLKKSSGSIAIKVTPNFAEAFINGRNFSGSQYLANGKYELTISAKNYSDYKEIFEIEDYENITRNINLTPIYGKLIIETDVDGATIKLSSADKVLDTQNDRLVLNELFEGDYTVEIIKSGYRELKEPIFVYGNRENYKNYKLEKIPTIYDDPDFTYNVTWVGASHFENSKLNELLINPKIQTTHKIDLSSKILKKNESLKVKFILNYDGKLNSNIPILYSLEISKSEKNKIFESLSKWTFSPPNCRISAGCKAAGILEISSK